MRPGDLVQIKKFPGKKEKILSPQFRLATMMGFVPSQMLVKAILTGKPNPIRWMYIQGGNPLLSYANATETFSGLEKNLNSWPWQRYL
jgi:anaerobic selenocysteine-containing dehydrogenase